MESINKVQAQNNDIHNKNQILLKLDDYLNAKSINMSEFNGGIKSKSLLDFNYKSKLKETFINQNELDEKQTYFNRAHLMQIERSQTYIPNNNINNNNNNTVEPAIEFNRSNHKYKTLGPIKNSKSFKKMNKKLEELNLNSSVFMNSSSNWNNFQKSSSFTYLDNKFQTVKKNPKYDSDSQYSLQHAKLSFYNHLLANKENINNLLNNYKLVEYPKADTNHNLNKASRNYLSINDSLGSANNLALSENYDSSDETTPNEASQSKNAAKAKTKANNQQNELRLKRHISIKHFANVEKQYQSPSDNNFNANKPNKASPMYAFPFRANLQPLNRTEEPVKDLGKLSASINFLTKFMEEKPKKPTPLIKNFNNKLKSKKNLMNEIKTMESHLETQLTDSSYLDFSQAHKIEHSNRSLELEKIKMKNSHLIKNNNDIQGVLTQSTMNTFPNLFSKSSKPIVNNPSPNRKRAPLNIINFDNMSVLNKYNLNLKIEEAFKYTKLLQDRNEKSSLKGIKLKFDNVYDKDDYNGIDLAEKLKDTNSSNKSNDLDSLHSQSLLSKKFFSSENNISTKSSKEVKIKPNNFVFPNIAETGSVYATTTTSNNNKTNTIINK